MSLEDEREADQVAQIEPDEDQVERKFKTLASAFSPSSPISDKDLFSGRREQLNEVASAMDQKGQHIIIYGERGVGKTSLGNILARSIGPESGYLAVRTNCDGSDDFDSVWRKVFSEIELTSTRRGIGFKGIPQSKVTKLVDLTSEKITPHEVRKHLTLISDSYGLEVVAIVDEFDRLRFSKKERGYFADCIKALSDFGTSATVVLVGVADSVNDLLAEHGSVERALVQIPMPRMSPGELAQIVKRGLARADMSISEEALTRIVRLSQGLPHYTHLIGLHAGWATLERGSLIVDVDDVETAIAKGVEKAQESIKTAYHRATTSPRRDTLYAHVLLACALTVPDSRGFFAASDVRGPMSRIKGRPYEIPAFSQHLNDFCEKDRGPILQKTGSARRYRFRFVNPLMQPFVIMNGLSKGTIKPSDLGAES